jgi:hypothetical protein
MPPSEEGWFDKLTTNGAIPFALSLSKGGHCG